MPVSTLSNEHYEALLRDVSLVVGGAVIQLINLNKKVSGNNILAHLVNEIEHETNQQRSVTLRSAIEVMGQAPRG
ncbi:biofilm development regulator YmgB/AriR family protein [Pseudomonas lundensis]|uniref:biofilm development regulator YmgB/AriR family protein n=1 Tax=Serratia proteamaculans TaxID=28151 RepID=UPI002980CA23|nr:biofilm development regulator YmgB/AriR family protein [Serratia proteamaculans]MDW5498619.1 biofilm development regulator YmgB/AriR family protein [Serratia proteamaculans]MDW5503677.1 biofilm development regulator YmgB/AriR family protein [Pseudomonas lundensis]